MIQDYEIAFIIFSEFLYRKKNSSNLTNTFDKKTSI